MPTSCCVRGCKSKGNGKIKYFRFPRDLNRRLQWIQAVSVIRENFVPTNNTLICEAHFTSNDYQNRPDLIKLTHTAVPSIFNCQENEKQNASLKKVIDSRLKSSRMPARKRHGNLSDHTYVLKLPEESIKSKNIGPSKCVVHTLNSGESDKIPDSYKITFKPPEKNWENIAMIQHNTIYDLRKKVKVLHQKIRRYSSTIEALKEQLDIMMRY